MDDRSPPFLTVRSQQARIAQGIWPWVSHTHRAFRDPKALPPKELPAFVK